MTSDVIDIVGDGVHSAKIQVCLREQASAVKLFLPFEPPDSMVIDMLSTQPKSRHRFQLIFVTAIPFIKLV